MERIDTPVGPVFVGCEIRMRLGSVGRVVGVDLRRNRLHLADGRTVDPQCVIRIWEPVASEDPGLDAFKRTLARLGFGPAPRD